MTKNTNNSSKTQTERKELIAKRPVKKELITGFTGNQFMQKGSFEIYYYNDSKPEHVSWHDHEHYEFYLFLEGDVDYQIEDQIYHLEYGDYLLIPPKVLHRPIFGNSDIPYRRFVLWIGQDYFRHLCDLSQDYAYAYDAAKEQKLYHYRQDYIQIQDLQGRLTDLIEESRSSKAFHDLSSHLMMSQLLIHLNRLTHDKLHKVSASPSNMLYLDLCFYINNHLNEDLSLDSLAAYFFVSKYHISHIFKDNMGISLHQYILKKRLHACKNAILSGLPLNSLFQQYGFSDYSSFYRAFRKEYGLSPTEFRENHKLPE